MASIVKELQADALNKNVTLSDLLRKSYLVASKLKQADFINWLTHEMNGYPKGTPESQFPSYRQLKGEVKVYNPYHGFQPVLFEDTEVHESYSKTYNNQSLAEIEFLLAQYASGGHFEMNFPNQVVKDLMDALNTDLIPSLHVSGSSIFKILDSARNIILKWTLQLEEDGILGENLTFSSEDQLKATAPIYNINNFFGGVSNSQIQQGTNNSKQEYKK